MTLHTVPTPSCLEAAKALSEASDRWDDEIHNITLIADMWRNRVSEQQRQYWLRKDAERMFR